MDLCFFNQVGKNLRRGRINVPGSYAGFLNNTLLQIVRWCSILLGGVSQCFACS